MVSRDARLVNHRRCSVSSTAIPSQTFPALATATFNCHGCPCCYWFQWSYRCSALGGLFPIGDGSGSFCSTAMVYQRRQKLPAGHRWRKSGNTVEVIQRGGWVSPSLLAACSYIPNEKKNLEERRSWQAYICLYGLRGSIKCAFIFEFYKVCLCSPMVSAFPLHRCPTFLHFSGKDRAS